MKKMALPFLGALICLQFTAGCLDSGQAGSSQVRMAKGAQNGANSKLAQKAAQESSIQETAFNFTDDDGYRIYVDPIMANITAQDKTGLGLAEILARKWTVLSLYNKSVPDDVYLAPKVKDLPLAWVSAKAVRLDKTTYESYLTQDRAKILVTLLVTTLRLETKGVVVSFDDGDGSTVTAGATADTTDTAVAAVAELKDRKPLPVRCNDSSGQPMSVADCLAQTKSTEDDKRSALLNDQDKKNIEAAANYLLQSGRSAKIDDIKKQLQDLTIIK